MRNWTRPTSAPCTARSRESSHDTSADCAVDCCNDRAVAATTATGPVRAAELQVAGLTLTDVSAEVTIVDNHAHFRQLTAHLGDGRVSGTLSTGTDNAVVLDLTAESIDPRTLGFITTLGLEQLAAGVQITVARVDVTMTDGDWRQSMGHLHGTLNKD